MGCGPKARIDLVAEKNQRIADSVKSALDPSQEPVMWGTIISNLVVVYLTLVADFGYEIPESAVGAVVGTITALGLLLRSQYTPYIRK
jgi:hypothetical protein